MKVIKAGYEILTSITGHELEMIERAGRTCYKSEDKITEESAKKFVRNLINRQHEAMLEHSSLTVKFICDRGVSHELVRHRVASFAQESTRYCNYSQEKFGSELTFILPFWWDRSNDLHAKDARTFESEQVSSWWHACDMAEQEYFNLLKLGCTPQEARSVLPNSLKTEVVMTANYREWRHFFDLRAARITGQAHPQMEEITIPLLLDLHNQIPIVFDDIWDLVETHVLVNGGRYNG